MKNDRNTAVLYSTATCNLKCRYCYIDKNPSLIKIDNLLDESFKDDYYFNFSKEIFDKEKLSRVEIWGGEPSARLDRTYYTIRKMIEYYPNLKEFSMSTNLTLDNFLDQFYGFLDVLGEFPEREFQFYLQLSLDGPTYINDLNRGKGVTQDFSKNFVKLILTISEVLEKYKNISVFSFFKATLDNSSIRFLQTKEKIIEYYQFFENYKKIAEENVYCARFNFDAGIPNTACPSPHTKEDGQLFANLVKLAKQIEKENVKQKYFQYYKKITPFGYNRIPGKNNLNNCGMCGSGHCVIGMLPNKIISTCHNGFTQLLSDYKQYCLENIEEVDRTIDFTLFAGAIQNDMVFPFEFLSRYEKQVAQFYDHSQCFLIENYIGIIQFLALCNQIDEQYKDFDKAKKAANEIFGRTSICVRDNLSTTGSKTLSPVGLFKLLLNGAMDYLVEEE